MPTAKHRKNHKKKAQAYKLRLQDNKRRADKFQRELVMKLIEQEKQKGLFENNPTINHPTINPILPLDGPQVEINQGPVI
jgi:hypothetical protein